MRASSGILLTTGAHWLVAERSPMVDNPLVWGVPGGGVPRDVMGRPLPDLPSAVREFVEEMGAMVPATFHLRGRTIRRRRRGPYTTFVLHVPDLARQMVFAPNYETGAYGWVEPDRLEDLPLHRGFAEAAPALRRLAVFPVAPVPPERPWVQELVRGWAVGGGPELERQRSLARRLERALA